MFMNVSYHFLMGDAIIICGHYGLRRFVCRITPMGDDTHYNPQTEGRIYLCDNNGGYCVEVQIQNSGFEEMCDLDWYCACLHELHISKDFLKQRADVPFCYREVYGLPAYVWCVAVGMIAADL